MFKRGNKAAMTLEHAFHYAEQLTRAHSSTFYLGSRLFPGKQRQAVNVIYTACRLGDNAVDEAATPEDARRQLAQWWTHIELAYRGKPRTDEPLELGLAWVLEHYPVPKAAFEELYLGFESDLAPCAFETLNDLMVYSRRVAGVVGLMIVPIAGYRGGERTLLNALALGQAMQITNILRDVGEDLERRRCYLPQELLDKHGVSLRDLQEGRVTENYIALLKELTVLAHKLYRLGWQGIPNLQGVTAAAVGVAALNYEAILDKLRKNQYDNLTRRAHLRTFERIALIPRAVVACL